MMMSSFLDGSRPPLPLSSQRLNFVMFFFKAPLTLLGSTGLYLQKEGTGRETDTDFDMKILTHRVRAEKKHMVNVVQFGHDTINACIV